MTLLEDLYYGNICPAVREIKKNSEYDKLVKQFVVLEEKFTSKLSKEQKDMYEELCDINSDLQGMREFSLFKYGFRLALGFSQESAFSNDPNFAML